MRVTSVVVVLALAAAGCEKTPPAGESAKQLNPAGEVNGKPGAGKPGAAPPTALDEGAGEPMDDVDEAESPSDRSGAGDPSAAEGDGPEGDEIDVEE